MGKKSQEHKESSSQPHEITDFLKKPVVHLLIIISVGFLAYSNTFFNPFQWDGIPQIVDNPLIQDIRNFIASTTGYEYNPRRFMGYLSFSLNYQAGGFNVTGYHVVNLIIHIINAVLVYFFIILTFRTPFFSSQLPVFSTQGSGNQTLPASSPPSRATFHLSRLTALFSALLFVAHPIQTQAVTYVVQRFASLATMFYLLSLLLYVKGRLTSLKPAKLASYGLAVFFAFLAMRTKEIAFTLPLVLTAYEFTFFKSSLRKKLLFLLLIVLAMIVIIISVVQSDKSLGEILSDVSKQTRLQTDMSRWVYLMTELRVIVTYIRLIFLPINQNIDYDYPIYHSLFSPPVFFSFLFLLSLFGGAVYFLYRSGQAGKLSSYQGDKPASGQAGKLVEDGVFDDSRFTINYLRFIAFGVFWFFVTLLVESSVIPIVDVIFEHRVYLPSVGAFSGIAAGVMAAAYRFRLQKIVISALCLAIAALSAATYARNDVWKNNISLWEDVVKKSPQKIRARYNLGEAYFEMGRKDEALKEYQMAVNIKPGDAEAHYNLGTAYAKGGLTNEAIQEFQAAINIAPDYAYAHNNLGTAYANQGRINESLEEFKAAIKLMPDYAEAYFNLGNVYMKLGRNDDAIREFRTAVSIIPDYADVHYNMGIAYSRIGDMDAAVSEMLTMIKLRPGDADAHLNLGNFYFNQGRIDEAVREFQTAVEIRPDHTEAHNNLGAGYFRQGKIDEAIREFQITVNLDPNAAEARRNLENLSQAARQHSSGNK